MSTNDLFTFFCQNNIDILICVIDMDKNIWADIIFTGVAVLWHVIVILTIGPRQNVTQK